MSLTNTARKTNRVTYNALGLLVGPVRHQQTHAVFATIRRGADHRSVAELSVNDWWGKLNTTTKMQIGVETGSQNFEFTCTGDSPDGRWRDQHTNWKDEHATSHT